MIISFLSTCIFAFNSVIFFQIRSIVDADATIHPVIAAGIVTKVHRDKLMHQLHKQSPVYNWRINKGYEQEPI